jgi:histone deacetylase 1/2
MGREFDALMENGTWFLCPRPLGKHVMRNKWVYKVKRKPDGNVERFKARLVAKGYDQRSGIDFHETFSSVIKPTTIRLVLAIVVHFHWPIRQLDVSNAFLHGFLDEEVFMEQPQGFIDETKPDFVCRLHKSLYGLKQVPRAWFQCLSQQLIELGFQESINDYSLFTLHIDNTKFFVLIYVDDILVTGSSSIQIDTLIRSLQSIFQVKDLSSLSYFLGVEIDRNSQGLHLCQTKYICDLLHHTKMVGAKPFTSPTVTSTKLSSFDGEVLSDPTDYRYIIGALQYWTITRPNIAYVVNQLCQYMRQPRSSHWQAMKRVLCYLKGTVNDSLYYTPSLLDIHTYCDSDWVGNPDDRRSTSGYGMFLGHNLVS